MKEEFKTKTNQGHEQLSDPLNDDIYVEVDKDDFPLFNPKGKVAAFLVHLLLVFWMFPQSLLGLLFAIVTGWRYLGNVGGAFYFRKPGTSSVTLGYFLFISDAAEKSINTASHEYGHHINSQWSGWFYLLIIGLPSIIACATVKDHDKYLNFYPEKWAEKFGRMYFPVDDYKELLKKLGITK